MKYIVDYHYFGNITYYYTLVNALCFDFRTDLPYEKSSWRNKLVLAGPEGSVRISIPISGGREQKQLFNKILIDHSQPWQRNHFRTICTLYNRSPFFEFYFLELEKLFQTKVEYLAEWNKLCTLFVLKKLKITDKITAFNFENLVDLPTNVQMKTSKKDWQRPIFCAPYQQVFAEKVGFQPDCSVLDVLFCLGPQASHYLRDLA